MKTTVKNNNPPAIWKGEDLIKFLEFDSALQVKEPGFYSINRKLRGEVRTELLKRLKE